MISELISKYKYYLLALIPALVIVFANAGKAGDFEIFLLASSDLLEGSDFFKAKYIDGYHYYYSVFFGMLLVPLTCISLYWANVIWLIISMLMTFRLVNIIASYLPLQRFSSKQRWWLFGLSAAFVFGVWIKNIGVGQMTILMLYLCLEGVKLIDDKKVGLGSLLIAFGTITKILPIVLIPYFLYRANYKAALYTTIFTGLFMMIPALIIGWDYHIQLLSSRWELINPTNAQHLLDVEERSFHSLTTLLATLFVENASNPYTLDIKRNLLNVSVETLGYIITAVRLLFVGLTLWFVRSLPFRLAESRLQRFYELSYILMVIPLIFPHQQHYSFFMMLPAVSYLMYFMISKYFMDGEKLRSKQVLIVLLSLTFLTFNSHFILGEFNWFYDHFKTLTYGAITLVFVLGFCSPSRLEVTH